MSGGLPRASSVVRPPSGNRSSMPYLHCDAVCRGNQAFHSGDLRAARADSARWSPSTRPHGPGDRQRLRHGRLFARASPVDGHRPRSDLMRRCAMPCTRDRPAKVRAIRGAGNDVRTRRGSPSRQPTRWSSRLLWVSSSRSPCACLGMGHVSLAPRCAHQRHSKPIPLEAASLPFGRSGWAACGTIRSSLHLGRRLFNTTSISSPACFSSCALVDRSGRNHRTILRTVGPAFLYSRHFIAGFAVLLASGFSGLRQLGLLSMVTLIRPSFRTRSYEHPFANILRLERAGRSKGESTFAARQPR